MSQIYDPQLERQRTEIITLNVMTRVTNLMTQPLIKFLTISCGSFNLALPSKEQCKHIALISFAPITIIVLIS